MPERSGHGPTFNTRHIGSGDVNNVVGRQYIHHGGSGDPGGAAAAAGSADIGVITVLHQEAGAVVEMLKRADGYRSEQLPDGTQAHLATVPGHGGPLRVVAVQALQPGTHAAVEAFHRLRRRYAPSIVAIAGIAGSIRTGSYLPADVGAVVIADQVIGYDQRREAPDATHHRGQSHLVASVLQHRLNEFFLAYGATGVPHPDGSRIRLHRAPIGSGSAVIADAESASRRWVSEFHEKAAAVETETIGVAHACHEAVQDGTLRGWLAIRGISDRADAEKGHADHDLAADHAAVVLRYLLPYLWLAPAGHRAEGPGETGAYEAGAG